MKTKIIIMSALVALVAAGCGKEKSNGLINIFAEQMTAAGNGKVLIDPDAVNEAQWVLGEQVNLNGTALTIADNGEGGYQVDASSLGDAASVWAVYPASINADGNSIITTNSNGSTSTVVMKSLTLNFHGDGTHDVYFPMASEETAATASGLELKHLTGGMNFTLHNTGSAVNLATLKVITQTEAATASIATSYGTASWDVQGPALPSGTVGSLTDADMRYACQMHLNLKSGSDSYVTVAASGDLRFCVPITVNSVKKVTVVGYDNNGVECFTKSATLSTPVTIERNVMYNMKTINF